MQSAEATPKSGTAIVQKTWADRLNDEPELESDADEQLLMYIPYVSTSYPFNLKLCLRSRIIFTLLLYPTNCPSSYQCSIVAKRTSATEASPAIKAVGVK